MSLQDIASIHRTSPLRRRLPSIACGILLTAFAGCSDNRSTTLGDDLPSVGNPVEINILTNGIESFADAEEVATRSALAGSTEAVQTLHTQVQPLEDGRLLVATLKASKATRAAAASPTGTRATLTNTTLRVLAYNSDGQYVDDCIYNVNGFGTATAPSGQSLVVPARATPYTFYCYSPGVCESNTETKQVSVGAADAFAFGTQIATIDGSNSTQTIAFPTLAQKSAKIKLAVTSVDNPVAAVSCTATLTGTFANSVFSLASDTYSGTSIQSKFFDISATEIAVPTAGASSGEMTLTLSSLVVDGGALLPLSIKIPAITLAAGTRYTLAIKVNKVSTKAPYVILSSIGLRVAKGNLMRANGTGHWYLAPDQGYYTGEKTGGDYFSWGIDNPTSYGSSVSGSSMDAVTAGCAAVLGAGWRVPTKADNEKLAAGANVWGTYSSQRGTSNGRYFGIGNVPSADKQDDYVFLPAAGGRDDRGSMFSVGNYGLYWSGESNGGSNAYYLSFGSNSISGAGFSVRSNGHSVRCVTNY